MSSHCFKSGPLGCDQGLYKMHLTSFMVQPSAKTEGLWRMQLSHQALDAVQPPASRHYLHCHLTL